MKPPIRNIRQGYNLACQRYQYLQSFLGGKNDHSKEIHGAGARPLPGGEVDPGRQRTDFRRQRRRSSINYHSHCRSFARTQEHRYRFRGELASILQKYFVVVPGSVGRYDRNLDIARQYDVPLRHGIPALAILDSHGKLLYSMKDGQFSNARSMDSASFIEFFRKWEPKR